MRKSIADEYFTLCLSILAAALVCMASVLICHSVIKYKNNRYTMLERSGIEARYRTISLIDTDPDAAGDIYRSMSRISNIDFLLFNNSGDVLVCSCSETSPCLHTKKLPVTDIMQRAEGGETSSVSTLGGFFDEAKICTLFDMETEYNDYYLLAYMSSKSMLVYLRNKVLIAAAVFVLLMLIFIPLLKYNIRRISNPIREMTMAAKRFGEGDFSEKVVIKENNELGFLANTLNEMASSLEAIEENRKSFISNVSHELRTPMTTIGGFVDGILDGTIPENMHKQYLRTVSEEINRLARLVRSMLNISKYEAGELSLQTEDFDITELTVKTVLLFEKRIEAKNIDIRGLDTDRFFVNADKDLIQQVIYNLTENAVKFVNDGGYISYDFRSEDKSVFVTIRNSGEGLKKNEINKVFDRFYKTDESRGKDKTGVGLGLSIVRSIVKLHEGSILVRSKQGEYTEFEFSVPAGDPPAKRSE